MAGSFLSNRDEDRKVHSTRTTLPFLGEAVPTPVMDKEIMVLGVTTVFLPLNLQFLPLYFMVRILQGTP